MLFFENKNIIAPLDGKCIPLSEVDDEAFAGEMMGPGCAIIPDNGDVVSPVDGKVSVIAPTKHCIGITCVDGLEVMIHFGIDSFKTEGKGFEYCVEVQEDIKKGQPICRIDLDFFKQQAIDMTTPIVILNHDKFLIKEYCSLNNNVKRGQNLLKYKAK